MNARDELAGIIQREYIRAINRKRVSDCWDAPADAILSAGYTRVPMAEIQEQVNHMYAAAKQGENMFGENTASDHLRHFADKIGALITTGDAA